MLTLFAFAFLSQAAAQSDVETGAESFPLNIDFGQSPDKPAIFSAEYVRIDSATGRLSVTAKLGRGYHVYSVTQAEGGPTPTTIQVDEQSVVKVIGSFEPDRPPLQSENKAWPGLTIEEHNDKVVWSAKIGLSSEFSSPIKVVVKSLVCMTDGSCTPFDESLVAEMQVDVAVDEDRRRHVALHLVLPDVRRLRGVG